MHITAKRSTTLLAIALTFMLVLFGCSESAGPVKDQQIDQAELSLYQGALAKGNKWLANELRLKYFAQALARTLTAPGIGAYLKDEIGKKFDGDYDALWETVKDREFPDQGRLRGLVASALKEMNSIVSIDEIEEVPLLQVALPVNFETWDGETPIPVSYTPLTVDDLDVEELVVFDAAGNTSIMDVSDRDWEPDYPMLIVGINERPYHRPFSSTTSSTLSKQTSASAAAAVDEGIFIHRISLKRSVDLERWWMGDLEMVVRKPGDWTCLVNADVDRDDTACDGAWIHGWFTVWGSRVDVRFTTTQESVDIQVFEDDTPGNDYVIIKGTLSYPGWSISDIDEGDYYMCGNYKRCAYQWLWGTTSTGTFDCR